MCDFVESVSKVVLVNLICGAGEMDRKRKNRLTCFVTLVLVSGLAGGAFADTIWNGSESSNWTVAANWDAGVPDAADKAYINDSSVTQPVIADGHVATSYQFLSVMATALVR